ncbi:MAG: glycosyltransferase [Desulfovibrio sp.]|jgi:GT2 family glycosyltransferase|nr:glycosyltransferase [Desulfovibrio sp.]
MISTANISSKKIYPSVNITIVTWNRVNLTRLCIDRLLSTKLYNTIIHIIDNGSTDGTHEYLSHLSKINDKVKVFFFNRNYGVSVAANYGWSLTESDYYLKIDNDIEILDNNWLENLLNFSERNKEIGMLGYRLLEKHKVTPVYLSSGDLFHEFTGCGGGIVSISRNIHNQCGFWNEDYGSYGFEDLDYGNRVLMIGYRTGYHASANSARHLGYEVDVDTNQEKLKQSSVCDIRRGEKLYLINKFLFENKIRSLNVARKFLPVQHKNNIYFKLNRDYLSIIKIQTKMMSKINYTKDNDIISLDFNSFKS